MTSFCRIGVFELLLMATSIRLIRRYVWLVETIRRAGSLTLEEINSKWARNTSLNIDNDEEIPERTFHRHREAIAELFDIDIRCNRFDGNRYYIENIENLESPSFTSRLFKGLAIDNQMTGNPEVYERILFEETPAGQSHLSPIIEALAERKVLSVHYRRFGSDDEKEWRVEPALLKQSGRRWYLIGRIAGHDGLTVFALDRITGLELTDQTFSPSETESIKERFEEVIGVNLDDDFDCERVVIRVYGRQRAYVETLPLHKSQRLVRSDRESSDYELTLRPEYEFQRELLRLGPEAQVISPRWLREEIKWLAEEVVKRYES